MSTLDPTTNMWKKLSDPIRVWIASDCREIGDGGIMETGCDQFDSVLGQHACTHAHANAHMRMNRRAHKQTHAHTPVCTQPHTHNIHMHTRARTLT